MDSERKEQDDKLIVQFLPIRSNKKNFAWLLITTILSLIFVGSDMLSTQASLRKLAAGEVIAFYIIPGLPVALKNKKRLEMWLTINQKVSKLPRNNELF